MKTVTYTGYKINEMNDEFISPKRINRTDFYISKPIHSQKKTHEKMMYTDRNKQNIKDDYFFNSPRTLSESQFSLQKKPKQQGRILKNLSNYNMDKIISFINNRNKSTSLKNRLNDFNSRKTNQFQHIHMPSNNLNVKDKKVVFCAKKEHCTCHEKKKKQNSDGIKYIEEEPYLMGGICSDSRKITQSKFSKDIPTKNFMARKYEKKKKYNFEYIPVFLKKNISSSQMNTSETLKYTKKVEINEEQGKNPLREKVNFSETINSQEQEEVKSEYESKEEINKSIKTGGVKNEEEEIIELIKEDINKWKEVINQIDESEVQYNWDIINNFIENRKTPIYFILLCFIESGFELLKCRDDVELMNSYFIGFLNQFSDTFSKNDIVLLENAMIDILNSISTYIVYNKLINDILAHCLYNLLQLHIISYSSLSKIDLNTNKNDLFDIFAYIVNNIDESAKKNLSLLPIVKTDQALFNSKIYKL